MVPNVAVLASQGRAVLLALPAAGRGQALQLVVVQIDAAVSDGDGVPRAGPGVPWYCFRRRCFRSIIFGFDQ